MFRLFFNYFAFGARARVRLPISIPTEPFLAWSFIGRMVLRRVAARSEHNFHWQEESPRLPLRSTPDEFGSIGPASRTGPAANAQAYHISASSGPTNFRQKPETRPVLEHGTEPSIPLPPRFEKSQDRTAPSNVWCGARPCLWPSPSPTVHHSCSAL